MIENTFQKSMFWLLMPASVSSIVMVFNAVDKGIGYGISVGFGTLIVLTIVALLTAGLYAGLRDYNIGTCLEQILGLLLIAGVPLSYLYLLFRMFQTGQDFLSTVGGLVVWTIGVIIYQFILLKVVSLLS